MEANIIKKDCMKSILTRVTDTTRRKSLCNVLSASVSELLGLAAVKSIDR